MSNKKVNSYKIHTAPTTKGKLPKITLSVLQSGKGSSELFENDAEQIFNLLHEILPMSTMANLVNKMNKQKPPFIKKYYADELKCDNSSN